MCLNEAIDIQYLKHVYFTTSSPATSRALLICFSDQCVLIWIAESLLLEPLNPSAPESNI